MKSFIEQSVREEVRPRKEQKDSEELRILRDRFDAAFARVEELECEAQKTREQIVILEQKGAGNELQIAGLQEYVRILTQYCDAAQQAANMIADKIEELEKIGDLLQDAQIH